MDGKYIVDNGGGHGSIRKCGLVKGLKAGKHTVKVTWWQGYGGMRIKATYSGPDTRGRERLLGAPVPWAPKRVLKSNWYVPCFLSSFLRAVFYFQRPLPQGHAG